MRWLTDPCTKVKPSYFDYLLTPWELTGGLYKTSKYSQTSSLFSYVVNVNYAFQITPSCHNSQPFKFTFDILNIYSKYFFISRICRYYFNFKLSYFYFKSFGLIKNKLSYDKNFFFGKIFTFYFTFFLELIFNVHKKFCKVNFKSNSI